jgi:hypothetical protein
LLLLLAGCDRSDDAPGDGGAPLPTAAAGRPLTKEDAARMLQEKALIGLRAILPNPDDAMFAEVRPGTAGAVCGKIDTEQPDGKRSGFRPFVVTPEGVGVISLSPDIMLNDPEDIFPDYYIRWCATPAELATLKVAEEINLAAPVTEVPEDLAELAEAPPVVEVPVPTPPPAATAKAPAAPSPANAGELESFSKVVIRGEGKETR